MKKILIVILSIILFAAIAVGGYFGYEAYIVSKAPAVSLAAAQIMDEIMAEKPADNSRTEQGKALAEAYNASVSYRLEGEGEQLKRDGRQTVVISAMDSASLFSDELKSNAQAVLTERVEQAKLSSEIYNEDLSYKAEVLAEAADEAFYAALENTENKEISVQLQFYYDDGVWTAVNIEEVRAAIESLRFDSEEISSQLLAAAVENPEYVRKIYTIEETAKAGPEPDRSKFGSTTDPTVIEELIATPLAQQLIGDRKLAWNKDIELIPGTEIHYYLDETILSIVWQEEEALAVGTFAETIIADASQLRRKIAGDTYQNYSHTTASEFAKQTNAVLAVGGDLYHHQARNCGIMVYEREIYRFEPNSCDTCYITANGDMLFSYRGQFKEVSEAEKFVKENDVLFSLCFGPALIDDGKDVTPYMYTWGEVLDTYARSALGMLGDKHYLTMNINCKLPYHYYLATLRQAADAMIAKGCIKAYALDGGQTATTVFNNQLINPVQFGWEREISDIIYFATAIPN